jgi:hypothetical protein
MGRPLVALYDWLVLAEIIAHALRFAFWKMDL